MHLDYTTVRHHLQVLQRNHLIEVGGEHYGQVYFVAPSLEERWAMLETIHANERSRSSRG
ncbi:MAG: hypothetical protein ACREBT_05335 [Thermoplasmata archaeon]